MLSKEEIEKAKGWLSALDIKSEFESISKEIILSYIDQLEFQIQAKEKEHKYDVNMIDEVKGESVKLYKEIRKQNKIIDEMAEHIANWDIEEDICTKVEKPLCNNETTVPVSYCIECVKQYFEKKVEEKNND